MLQSADHTLYSQDMGYLPALAAYLDASCPMVQRSVFSYMPTTCMSSCASFNRSVVLDCGC